MRSRLACLLIGLTVLLSGCWDRTSIEDAGYALALAVDRAGGEEYVWTFRIVEAEALPVGMITVAPRSDEELALSSRLHSVRAATIEQAVQMLQASLTRILSLDHVRYLIVGEELARAGVGNLLAQVLRNHEIRRGTGVVVARGRAVDLLVGNKPAGEINPAKFMEGVLLVQKRMHLSPPARLQHFYSRLTAPGVDPIAPLAALNSGAQKPLGSPLPPVGSRSLKAGEFPRQGGNPVEVAGTAVFHKDRLAGFLNVDESIAVLALRGEMGKVYQTVPDLDGKPISIRYGQENKPKYTATFVNGKPTVHIKLVLDGEVLATSGLRDYTRADQCRRLQEKIADYYDDTVYNPLVQKLYREWGADPIGLGQVFRYQFPTFPAWLDYRWEDRTRDVRVTVESELHIRRFGLLLDGQTECKGR